jgi:hypothetical protein
MTRLRERIELVREQVAEFFFFGFQVFFGVGAGGDFAGDALGDADSGAF